MDISAGFVGAFYGSNDDASTVNQPANRSQAFGGVNAGLGSLAQIISTLAGLLEQYQSKNDDGDETESPVTPEPARRERTLAGDELGHHLTASGGEKRQEDGVWGVSGGRHDDEINTDETMTFTLPDNVEGEVTGARISLDKLYGPGGKDGEFTEKAEVIAYDADGKEVGRYGVEGQNPQDPGFGYITIDQPFESLEFRAVPNGAGDHNHNSDYAIRDITLFTETGASEVSEPGDSSEVSDPTPVEGDAGSESGKQGGLDNAQLQMMLAIALMQIIMATVQLFSAQDQNYVSDV